MKMLTVAGQIREWLEFEVHRLRGKTSKDKVESISGKPYKFAQELAALWDKYWDAESFNGAGALEVVYAAEAFARKCRVEYDHNQRKATKDLEAEVKLLKKACSKHAKAHFEALGVKK